MDGHTAVEHTAPGAVRLAGRCVCNALGVANLRQLCESRQAASTWACPIISCKWHAPIEREMVWWLDESDYPTAVVSCSREAGSQVSSPCSRTTRLSGIQRNPAGYFHIPLVRCRALSQLLGPSPVSFSEKSQHGTRNYFAGPGAFSALTAAETPAQPRLLPQAAATTKQPVPPHQLDGRFHPENRRSYTRRFFHLFRFPEVFHEVDSYMVPPVRLPGGLSSSFSGIHIGGTSGKIGKCNSPIFRMRRPSRWWWSLTWRT